MTVASFVQARMGVVSLSSPRNNWHRCPEERRALRPCFELCIKGNSARRSECVCRAATEGGPTVPPQSAQEGLKPGDLVLDKYRINARIGEGSNGVTYSGTDNDSGSTVAVKELKLGAMKNWKQFELFEREAATLRGLSHPGIPKYIDYGQADGRVILVQELADGPNLSQMVREGTRFDEAEVERIAKELLIILKYLSSRRPPVIHRDIKPENVVLESGKPGSRVLLVDFGGVQDVVSTASAGDVFGSTIVGTAGYMPAEQFNGQASPASDMYALGGVLLFLLSGRTPGQFASERLRVSFEREIEVAPTLSKLLQALLEPIAEDRPTASQALGILDGTYSPTPSSSKPASSAITPTGSPNRFALQQGQYFTDLPPLARPWRDVSTSRAPSKTRVEVTQADDMLIVDVPPSGLTGGVAANLGFSVIWNVFVGVWTAGALASGGILFALFSVPFWFVGLNTTRQAISSALVHETISISGSEWTLSQALARVSGGVAKFLEGDQKVEAGETSELRGAKVVTTTITNGRPDTAVELLCGRERILVGEGLTLSEQEYCVAVINRHLENVSGPVEVENDLYPSTQAVIVNSSSSFDRPGSFSSRQRPYDTWEDMDDPFRRRF